MSDRGYRKLAHSGISDNVDYNASLKKAAIKLLRLLNSNFLTFISPLHNKRSHVHVHVLLPILRKEPVVFQATAPVAIPV